MNVQSVKDVVRFLGEYSVNLGKDCDFGPGLDRTAMLLERIYGEDPEDKKKLEATDQRITQQIARRLEQQDRKRKAEDENQRGSDTAMKDDKGDDEARGE